MELIYSMRRKPLKCEPPQFGSAFDSDSIRPICTVSVGNIIAFSSSTELSDADGDTWGGHVYVCDLDTPWDSHKVTSTAYPVSALEWDGEGNQLLVATTVGDVFVYGQKDYLLNEWTCLYSANFPGELIIKSAFFHNGRRVIAVEKKPDALITEKIQMLRSTPTLKGFGGVACDGACVVTASGLVCALVGGGGVGVGAGTGSGTGAGAGTGAGTGTGTGTGALCATECLRPARDHVTAAALAYKSGSLLIAAVCAGGGGGGRGRGCVRCYACSVSRPPPATPLLAVQPLPTIYLLDDGDGTIPASVAWCARDEPEALLVAGGGSGASGGRGAGAVLALWQVVERALPVHKLLSKGSGAPAGGPKPAAECFNTMFYELLVPKRWRGLRGTVLLPRAYDHISVPVHLSSRQPAITRIPWSCDKVWQKIAVWPIDGVDPAVCVASGRLPLGAPHAVLATSRAVHLFMRDTHHYLSSKPVGSEGAAGSAAEGPPAGAATPPKKAKHGAITSAGGAGGAACGAGAGAGAGGGAGGALVCCVALGALGGAAVALDARSQLHVYRVPLPATDLPTPVAVQHATTLLEYSMVSGFDCLDILMTLKQNLIEPVYDRLTETFQRQPQATQQYYFHGWLKLRIALCRLVASAAGSVSALASVQACHALRAAARAALRPDEKPDAAPAHLALLALHALLDDHAPEPDKNLLALEAKTDLANEALGLQFLRLALQRVLDVALTALLSFSHQHQHPSHYELWADPAAVALLRRLVVAARAAGRPGDALGRALARLPAAAPATAPATLTAQHKQDLLEECGALMAGGGARCVWDAAPRRSVSAPHGGSWPFYFEYGVEPEALRYNPEPPAYTQCDTAPSLAMDSIRYMYLGGVAARWRVCPRCGARALPAPQPARHPLQRAHDARFLPACRCGGKWTLFSNV